MACKHWKDDWVAHLYGELESAEEQELLQHLEDCAGCRETLEGLSASRELLQEGAPYVPAPPRVVVLQPRRSWLSIRSFAAGAACAVVVFGLGLFAGPRVLDDGASQDRVAALEPAQLAEPETVPATAESVEDLESEFLALQERLTRLEEVPQITPAVLDKQLGNLERRLNRERVGDLEQVLDSLTAAEMRTGSWMDQTDSRLAMLALSRDPRFLEQ